jgi:hypothetical protein
MPTTETKKEHGGAAVRETTTPVAATEGRVMLSLFASVGAHHFDVTLKDERTGKTSFDKGRTVNGLTVSLPSLLRRAECEEIDIIIRPLSKTPLIQLDDLAPAIAERVREFSFAIIETSRGNFQAWLAVTDATEATARRLKEATGADVNASGAVRLCGTKNHKPEYAPHFPTVRLIESQPGRTTTMAELRAAGLLAEKEEPRAAPPRAPSRFHSRTWPDYARCVSDAPSRKRGEGKDTSRADWQFALIAADRGFSAQEIASELMSLSEKAKRDGKKYAERTAQKAVESVEMNKAK